MRHYIRRFPRVWRATRLARRWYHARRGAYPSWPDILRGHEPAWDAARRAAETGPRVLLASSIGSYAHATTLESVLAVALTLRGARVDAVLCDSALPACAECDASLYPDLSRFVAHGPSRDLCRDCRWPSERVYRDLGVRTLRYSSWITADERARASSLARLSSMQEMREYRLDGLNVGTHATAGALRFLATGSLDDEEFAEPVLRRYFEAALLTSFGFRRLIASEKYRAVSVTHGIYVPWGLIGEVARREQVRLATWNVAYRKRRFIFSHGDTYHHTLMAEPHDLWEDLELDPAQERELMSYLVSRREGLFDWIVFHRPARQDPQAIADALGLDRSRPIVGMLTNVSWDAQLHYPANAFPSMLDWLVQTCRYFEKRPDLQLLLRVHPAEISGFPPSRQPMLEALTAVMPTLAPNIKVIPPESSLSTYAAMSLCNAAIIYGTKMGVELTSIGLPVIVAGEAWIRNKGITHDARTPEEYFAVLDRLPFDGRLSDDLLRRARRYAYHFFFNRMIPLPFVEPNAGYPLYTLKLDRFEKLLPGATPGLDVICDGILNGSPFVMGHASRAEVVPEPARIRIG